MYSPSTSKCSHVLIYVIIFCIFLVITLLNSVDRNVYTLKLKGHCYSREWLSLDTGKYSANTKHWSNAGLMFVHRLRRWTNVKTALGQRLVPARYGRFLTKKVLLHNKIIGEMSPAKMTVVGYFASNLCGRLIDLVSYDRSFLTKTLVVKSAEDEEWYWSSVISLPILYSVSLHMTRCIKSSIVVYQVLSCKR